MSRTVADLVASTLEAFDALTGVADAVVDEAQYIADLGVVWRARLTALADAHAGEPASDESSTAVATVIAESATVDDPHRAIDWLSTLPQVVLLALGERPRDQPATR
jgi:hypothetical protein